MQVDLKTLLLLLQLQITDLSFCYSISFPISSLFRDRDAKMLTSARLFHLLKGPGALSFLPRGQRAVLASSSSSITSLASLQRRPFHTTEKASESALTVWQDLKELRRSPTAPLIMGFSGLLPFAAAPLYMVQAGAFAPEVASAQLAYGAAILSFLGGVRWGMLVRTERVY